MDRPWDRIRHFLSVAGVFNTSAKAVIHDTFNMVVAIFGLLSTRSYVRDMTRSYTYDDRTSPDLWSCGLVVYMVGSPEALPTDGSYNNNNRPLYRQLKAGQRVQQRGVLFCSAGLFWLRKYQMSLKNLIMLKILLHFA